MIADFTDIVALIKAIAWPVVALVAIIVFRTPLLGLIKEISGRITKVSAFKFSIELTKAAEFKPSWSGPYLPDVRQLTPSDIFSSAAMALFEQIRSDTASDYAIIDLGTGQQWLTSRLFIFAIILERMRGLRCFVFLEAKGDIRRRFLGTATPGSVRWAIGRRYPWLEESYAKAYANLPDHQIRSSHGGLEPYTANQLVNNFLREIQLVQAPVQSQHEWVSLENQQLWEHASWLAEARIERVLGGILQDAWLLDSPDTPPDEKVKALLRRQGTFVALVDEERKFKNLVDRQALLEKVASHMGEPTVDRPAEKG